MAGDPKYLAWLRNRPCACQPCASPAEAHHSTVAPTHPPGGRPEGKQLGGKRGRGQKSHDAWAFSLCAKHHGQLHRYCGFFDGIDLTAWQNEQSAAYRAEYDDGADATGLAPTAKAPPRIVGLVDEARKLCEHYNLGRQIELDLTRLVRRAAGDAR